MRRPSGDVYKRQLLNLADGVLFVFPLALAGVEVLPHVGQLLLEFGQTGLGALVLLLLQGGFLNLQLDDLTGDVYKRQSPRC